MTSNSPTASPFALSLDDAVDYDPFDVADDNEDDESEDFDIDEDIPSNADGRMIEATCIQVQKPVDTRSPEQRIDDLFSRMSTRRRILLGIMSFCAEAQPIALVNEHIERLEAHDASVFSAAKYCEHLQAAGALECVRQDGSSYEEGESEPEHVIVDGVEYLRAAKPAEAFWRLTTIGAEVLASHRPTELVRALFAETPNFLPIYKHVLAMSAREQGCTIVELGAVIDGHPLVQKPRRFAQYFVDQLEKRDALIWKNGWFITEVGRICLEDLDNVETLESPARTGEQRN